MTIPWRVPPKCQFRPGSDRRSLHGPNKTVYFSQIHYPGRLAASDFKVCIDLDVTIARARFDHTLFRCGLTYRNVESVSVCFSESFEALSQGIQKAFWEFGGVPQRHRSSARHSNHAATGGQKSGGDQLSSHH